MTRAIRAVIASVIVFGTLTQLSLANPGGAPSCVDTPAESSSHAQSWATGTNPYVVKLTQNGQVVTSYVPGQMYTLWVNSTTTAKFTGYLYGSLASSTSALTLGSGSWFSATPRGGTFSVIDTTSQILNGGPSGSQCGITQKSSSSKSTAHSNWVAPAAGSGPITFAAIVVVTTRSQFYSVLEVSESSGAVSSASPSPVAVSPSSLPVTPSPTAVSSSPMPVTPSPTAVSSSPIPVTPSPTAVSSSPMPVTPSPTAVSSSPIPVTPSPTAVSPSPMRVTPSQAAASPSMLASTTSSSSPSSSQIVKPSATSSVSGSSLVILPPTSSSSSGSPSQSMRPSATTSVTGSPVNPSSSSSMTPAAASQSLSSSVAASPSATASAALPSPSSSNSPAPPTPTTSSSMPASPASTPSNSASLPPASPSSSVSPAPPTPSGSVSPPSTASATRPSSPMPSPSALAASAQCPPLQLRYGSGCVLRDDVLANGGYVVSVTLPLANMLSSVWQDSVSVGAWESSVSSQVAGFAAGSRSLHARALQSSVAGVSISSKLSAPSTSTSSTSASVTITLTTSTATASNTTAVFNLLNTLITYALTPGSALYASSPLSQVSLPAGTSTLAYTASQPAVRSTYQYSAPLVTSNGASVTLLWSLSDDGNTMIAEATSTSDSWFAFGFNSAPSMVGTDAVVVQPGLPSGQGMVRSYAITAHNLNGVTPASMSAVAEASAVVVTAASGVGWTVQFTRGMSGTGAANSVDLTHGTVYAVAAVGATGVRTMVSRHSSTGILVMNAVTGASRPVTSGAYSMTGTIVAHAVISMLGAVVLVPMGSVIGRYYTRGARGMRREKWHSAHVALSTIGIVTTVVGVIIGIAGSTAASHFATAHGAIGLAAMIGLVLVGALSTSLTRPAENTSHTASAAVPAKAISNGESNSEEGEAMSTWRLSHLLLSLTGQILAIAAALTGAVLSTLATGPMAIVCLVCACAIIAHVGHEMIRCSSACSQGGSGKGSNRRAITSSKALTDAESLRKVDANNGDMAENGSISVTAPAPLSVLRSKSGSSRATMAALGTPKLSASAKASTPAVFAMADPESPSSAAQAVLKKQNSTRGTRNPISMAPIRVNGSAASSGATYYDEE